jgi:hypothetical protein
MVVHTRLTRFTALTLIGMAALFSACNDGAKGAGEAQKSAFATGEGPSEYDPEPAQTTFSAAVTTITGDWVAEYTRGQHQVLHPDVFNKFASDHVLYLYPAEPKSGPSDADLLREYFEGWNVGDIDNKRPISVATASADEPGVLIYVENWGSYFGGKTSLFGIVTAANTERVPFRAECTDANDKAYEGEECLRKVFRVVIALRDGMLPVPPVTAPLDISGWSSELNRSGATALRFFDWIDHFAGRTSLIDVSAPLQPSPGDRKAVVETFLNGLYEPLGGELGAGQWEGEVYTRVLDHAEGPTVQTAMLQSLPNGQSVVIVVRCYNEGYRPYCRSGLAQVERQLQSGLYSQRFDAMMARLR